VVCALAAAAAVRAALDGAGAEEAGARVEAASGIGARLSAGESGLLRATMAAVGVAYAARDFDEVAGRLAAAAGGAGWDATVGFVAGAVASGRFGPSGWAYLVAIDGYGEDMVEALSDLHAAAGTVEPPAAPDDGVGEPVGGGEGGLAGVGERPVRPGGILARIAGFLRL
jgi:hypothetical protein